MGLGYHGDPDYYVSAMERFGADVEYDVDALKADQPAPARRQVPLNRDEADISAPEDEEALSDDEGDAIPGHSAAVSSDADMDQTSDAVLNDAADAASAMMREKVQPDLEMTRVDEELARMSAVMDSHESFSLERMAAAKRVKELESRRAELADPQRGQASADSTQPAAQPLPETIAPAQPLAQPDEVAEASTDGAPPAAVSKRKKVTINKLDSAPKIDLAKTPEARIGDLPAEQLEALVRALGEGELSETDGDMRALQLKQAA